MNIEFSVSSPHSDKAFLYTFYPFFSSMESHLDWLRKLLLDLQSWIYHPLVCFLWVYYSAIHMTVGRTRSTLKAYLCSCSLLEEAVLDFSSLLLLLYQECSTVPVIHLLLLVQVALRPSYCSSSASLSWVFLTAAESLCWFNKDLWIFDAVICSWFSAGLVELSSSYVVA
jgi:hypothetical protein